MSVKWGCHASVANGYLNAVETSLMHNCKAIQIWTGNNKSYNCKIFEKDMTTPVKKLVEKNDVFLIAHSPYILNFARPLQESPAGKRALQRYVTDMNNISALGGVGSVLHMGSNVKELKQTMNQAYSLFVDNLLWVASRTPENSIIILENMAGGGNRMCCKMDDWGYFWRNYILSNSVLKKRVRWCVDTAHLYATGEYDLSKSEEIQRFHDDFSEQIGWEYLLCFHFNGSKTAFGSKRDNHADISSEKCGLIDSSGMRVLAGIAATTDKPLILEVPTDTVSLSDQFECIEEWCVEAISSKI